MSDETLMAALQARAARVQALWGLTTAPELINYRENAVFRVRLGDGSPAALRLHRPGYHTRAVLQSELDWMAALARAGIAVPTSIATLDGALLVDVAADADLPAQHVDLVSWMAGHPIGRSGQPLGMPPAQVERVFQTLGQTMAQLHNASSDWTPPPQFQRPAWDAEGLLGQAPFWGRFWDCPGLTADQSLYFTALRLRLQQALAQMPELGFGLIHADLVRENVLMQGDQLQIIDFDDCGWGWHLFDIATALLKNRREPEFPLIQSALIAGYRTQRDLPDSHLRHLPLFLTLRALTYIGWAGSRLHEAETQARMARFIAEAEALARQGGF